MSEEIILGDLSEVSKDSDSEKALRTYYNYIRAISAVLEAKYGRNYPPRLLQAQASLPSFQAIPHSGVADDELKTCYRRGLFTLEAMKRLPVEQFPQLALSANFWLPVQAYYASHGIGLATLLSLNGQRPQYHSAFLSQISKTVQELFPFPLNVTVGGCRPNFVVSQVSVSPQELSQQSNLEYPPYRRPEVLMAKSLSTTRQRALDEKLSEARRKKVATKHRRRNLKTHEKANIVARLHNTTIFDFLYRIRIRSNYDDPDMYIFGQSDAAEAVRHYHNLLGLTESLIRCCEAIIRSRVGTNNFETLKKRIAGRMNQIMITPAGAVTT